MRPAAGAATVFGDRLLLAQRLADWLTGPGITRGLLGPGEADQIWQRHLLNGLGIATLIEPRSVVVDLGSGAGLPGLPLLLARPDLQMVLVEPKARRAGFLREVCTDLDLPATVVRARATPDGLVLLPERTRSAPIPLADVVTARAVASIADLARWAIPLLRPGGQLLAIKGATAAGELERDRPLLESLGYADIRLDTIADVPDTNPDAASATSAGPATATVIAMTLSGVSRET